MPVDAVLVIDAGTSAMRAVFVRADGNAEVVRVEACAPYVPEDARPFGREFDPAALLAALGRLLDASAKPRERIAGLAFTGQREGIACVDARGEPLFASPNVDARASAEGIAIDAAHAAEVYATTGHLPSLMQFPAKVAWMRTWRPDVAARIARVLPLADWLAASLTGAPRMSRTLAAENGALDVRSGALAAGLLERLGLPAGCLPEVVPDGAVAGQVRAGPFAGVPVVLAGADTQCGVLGAGAASPGEAAVPAGWSAPVQLVTAEPLLDAERRTWTGVHVAPGRWILESNAGETGRAWEWICTLMGLQNDEATALAATAAAGADDAMAVIGAPAMQAAAMSAGMGALTFPLPLVMSVPGRAEMLRAVLESVAYAVRGNVEQLEAVSGAPVERLRLGGGMSRSALFAQVVADVLDRPVDVARSPETSALGAAALASVTLGLHPTLGAALAAMTAPRRNVTPDMAASADYEDYYARWRMLAGEVARLAAEAG